MAIQTNPLRALLIGIGIVLERLSLVDRNRAHETTELAWPRIVTGFARMSKSVVDVAMVGVFTGSTAIAGMGFAGPYWGMTFAIGSGMAAGTIALVSQRYGAGADDELGQVVRSSALLVTVISLPVAAAFWVFPLELVGSLSDDPGAVGFGAEYLRVLALGVPFAILNQIGSRVLVGVDDAWTPMVVRSGGAVVNALLNTVLIFGLGMGVTGAALGTIIAAALVTTAFALGLTVGRLPVIGEFPVRIDVSKRYVQWGVFGDLVSIGLPVVGRSSVWTVARFPILVFVGTFGPQVVAAYVVSRRIWGLMNVPGWGFGLAASSLVGRALGANEEDRAAVYGHEITYFTVATYLLGAVVVAVFAEEIVAVFVTDPRSSMVPVATGFVYAACLAVVPQGVTESIAGALDATGDTNWPFYGRAVGMFVFAIPLTYLGATTSLGLVGLYLAFLGESLPSALISYYRFRSERWKRISRKYRPESTAGND
ncbi:MATE family efflux transporter [Halococcus hamelinensis]|uniref:Multidrug-efflux transporter n=1 Tax=Halococcus hamelinensis 100A6 TaxID=1132509 RepID=M0LV05_9EURY|nr:MATE family efflux transporter [Halococcus hamelinensis]EMA37296.1 efflux protein, mate family [Halococcus hamelinensis 100A6]